ncbi:MAG: VWA domain-containing protein [Phycisphaerae bacterium]|nr:VWA domain-containing protein [Phycisphaerae bacterium]
MVIATILAAMALGVAALGEWLHARRVARVARLAFGPGGRAAAWARVAPAARCVGMALAAWGAVLLMRYDPVAVEVTPSARASRQLLIVLDASPSMNLKDAGPGPEKMTRMQWAGRVVQGILDRLDMKDTRITMVAFYSSAVPLLQDTTDKNLISSVMGGVPLYTAFRAGETDMSAGILKAFELSRGWARGSTTLVVVSDGDLSAAPAVPKAPASIADAIVIGVGDPDRATEINGHSSRQDEWALRQVAAKLSAYFHQGNTKHLPTEVVETLASLAPRVSKLMSEREAGLAAVGVGAGIVGLIGPLLRAFGVPRSYAKDVRRVVGDVAVGSAGAA